MPNRRHDNIIGAIVKRLVMYLFLISVLSTSAIAEPQSKTTRGNLAFVQKVIDKIAKRPDFVAAIRKHNAYYANHTTEQIIALDKRWRANDRTVIDPVLSHPISKFLTEEIKLSKGRFAELIVMGQKGLAIAVSPKTTDLWQGDEAKWIETYSKGPTAFHADKVKKDESTNKWQEQISKTMIINGTSMGALTIGIDIAYRGN